MSMSEIVITGVCLYFLYIIFKPKSEDNYSKPKAKSTPQKLSRDELRSAAIRRKNEYNPSIDITADMQNFDISVSYSYNEPKKQSNAKKCSSYKKLTGKKAILNSFVVFDFETTGLNPNKNEIIEIGAIRVNDINSVTHETFSSLVRPSVPIPPRITKINGIDNYMVDDAKDISKVIKEFHDFIGDLPLIAHNASFDMKFLLRNLEEHGLEFMDNSVIDTLSLSRKAYPDLENHKLPTLVNHIGIKVNQLHRASDDSLAALYVYTTSMKILYGAYKSYR